MSGTCFEDVVGMFEFVPQESVRPHGGAVSGPGRPAPPKPELGQTGVLQPAVYPALPLPYGPGAAQGFGQKGQYPPLGRIHREVDDHSSRVCLLADPRLWSLDKGEFADRLKVQAVGLQGVEDSEDPPHGFQVLFVLDAGSAADKGAVAG